MRVGHTGRVRRFTERANTGCYFRVLAEGAVGDRMNGRRPSAVRIPPERGGRALSEDNA
ncbi:hypothetical protein HGA13_22440 [Nocardia speluncae]|uniref:Uncharacterized protein n=1 Tax=Nocardia speluncae TaxID=419477 RepID=A0A846XKL1_9NOCA|nr:hypothetical protein [Nocardia speluncae]NKY35809.1 hypothetical protein [Nocardia speluncae]